MYSYQDWVIGLVLLDTTENVSENENPVPIISISDFDVESQRKIKNQQKKIFNSLVASLGKKFINQFKEKYKSTNQKELYVSKKSSEIRKILLFELIYDKNLDSYVSPDGIPLFDSIFYLNMKNYYEIYKIGSNFYNYENIPFLNLKTSTISYTSPEIYYEALLVFDSYINKFINTHEFNFTKTQTYEPIAKLSKEEKPKNNVEKLAIKIKNLNKNWKSILQSEDILMFFSDCVLNFNPTKKKGHDVNKYTCIFYFLTDEIEVSNFIKISHIDYINFVTSRPIDADMNSLKRLNKVPTPILYDKLTIIYQKYIKRAETT